MPPYSDAELWELRHIYKLVCDAMQDMGLPIVNDTPIDQLIASGAFKAAECLVLSKDLVTPDWLEAASSGFGEPS